MTSSSSQTPPPKYDVFLSFSGEDTRDSFISHLYAELQREKIETFIDYKLGRGDEISPALYKAIDESMIYVVVLSENYASSTWCLDELTHILQCKEKYSGRHVIPVFYKVDPSDVRHQRESYAEAFVKHQRRFKDDQVNAWKKALTQIAALSGWDSQETRPEHTLVEDIVRDISRKLNLNYSFVSDYQGMIGIDKHIEQIQSMLHLESESVRMVGIWGMGGIGKTTIATAIYDKLANQFSSRSIVLNVQQEIERFGLNHIQSKYISELLGENHTPSRLSLSYDRIRRLKRTKVLLVLDDVTNSNHLNDLIGRCSSFGEGSRIIVTTRDKQVLKNVDADGIYEVKEMNFHESLQLFCLNAFKQNYPIEDYAGLTQKILNCAKGVPLALKVLGFLLRGRTREAWESQLEKLNKLPENDIFKVLKLSYKCLDKEQKNIFLDIACFYRGHLENVVTQTLDSCGFSAHIGMDVLKDRCLISISEGRIMMHDLIQEMGHEIVRQQCVNDPGKQSRLWKHDDIYKVLKRNKGTDAIQCIFLNMCKIEKVQLHPETFKKMDNLRMIQFYKPYGFSKDSNVILPKFLKNLPDDLKFLRWDSFPKKSLPLEFCPKNLVKLDMPHSRLEQLWKGEQDLPNLKTLDLRGSANLDKIPDLGQCPNIEEVVLGHCKKLSKVYSSSFLSKLKCLWLNGCITLKSVHIPSNILRTTSGLIVLHGCSSLDKFSVSDANKDTGVQGITRRTRRFQNDQKSQHDKFLEEPNRILEFHARSVSISMSCVRPRSQFLDPFDPSLNKLCWLDLSHCQSLKSLPIDLFKLKFLKRLYLRGCSNLEAFPEIEEMSENLSVLILDETAIMELPSSLHHLVGLEELSLHNCSRLEIIPSSIGSLSKLNKLSITYCESLDTFPSSIFKLKLTKLDLHGCLMLKTFPEILEPAGNFVHINLTKTAIKELPSSSETYCESLDTFPSSIFKLQLTKLDLHGCLMLKTFPEILEPVGNFVHINLTKTAIKELPSSLENLVGLQTLCLKFCTELVSLPNSIVNLNYLSELDCSGCCSLTEIPNNIGSLSSLRELSLQESNIVSLPESIAHLSSLKSLDLSDCKRLECIPQLPPSLNQLLACDCPAIGRMIPNSRLELPSVSDKNTFKFHFTNSQELDETGCSNFGDEAQLRITQDAYKSVFFCFPGSAIPGWFPYRCKGHSVTMKKDSLDSPRNNKLVGFALSVVLGGVDLDDAEESNSSSTYRLTFESDGCSHRLPIIDGNSYYFYWKGRNRLFIQDHTFIWKYPLPFGSIDNSLFDSKKFTFEFIKYDFIKSNVVKECGICPLYTTEKDDNCGNSLRL